MNPPGASKNRVKRRERRQRRLSLVVALTVTVSALFPIGAHGESERPPLKRQSLVAPLFVDGATIDSAWVFPKTETEPLLIETATLLKVLKDRLTPLAYLRLQNKIGASTTIDSDLLSSMKIQVSLRDDTLEAVMDIDPSIRVQGSASVAEDKLRGAAKAPNADWSGYLNALGSQSLNYGDSYANNHGREFDGSLFGVMNWRSWVLESGFDYAQRLEYHWTRQDTRLVHEARDNKWRFEFGDVQPLFVGFQVSPLLGGASFSRSQSVRALRSFRPVRDQTIFVKRPSRIEVYINGLYHSTVFATPGPFQLRDLPVSSALTNVELVITDDLGQTERTSASFLFDPEILSSGEEDYGFAVGAPSLPIDGDRSYERDQVFYSAFYRRGLDHLSVLGLNFQAQEGRFLVGTEGSRLFRRGILSMDIAGLSDDLGKMRGSIRARYRSRSLDPSSSTLNYFGTLQYRDANRGSVLRTDNGIQYPTLAEIGLTSVLDNKSTLTLSLREEYPVQASLSRRESIFMDCDRQFTRDFLGRVSFQSTHDASYNHSILFSLIWSDSATRQATLGYENSSDSLQAGFSYFPSEPIGGTRANARVSRSPLQTNTYAQAAYTGSRFESSVDHQGAWDETGSRGTTRLSAGAALVWANDHIALSRPLQGSFALVTAPENLDDTRLPINSRSSSAYTDVTRYAPGVVPGLADFTSSPVFIDQTTLPDGYSLRNYQYYVESGYRTGALIELQGEGTAMIITSLLDPHGNPLGFKSGEAVSLDHPDRPSVLFFTNSQGRMVIEGLSGGAYELRFYQEELRPMRLVLPAGARGIIEVAPITVGN